ncbi:hypothetical protein [Haloarchaeobius sp. TZWSO28]|uniref:hypothetical protein n=1 Tax=Haloarchaeobius sp. TZWSO28 TaxID=3446119 RepID=UPI003EC142F3
MPPGASADDWPDIEEWWGSYEATQAFRFVPAHQRALASTAEIGDWDAIDGLWEGFETNHEPISTLELWALPDRSAADAWSTVDTFWEGYAAEQRPELRRLQNLLATVREHWSEGASVFDEDPLSANWHPSSAYEGPLRATINEEDWSQWLAHLLRTSTGPFVESLFGLPSRPPETVRREVVFTDGEATRRIDILVEYPDTAVSVEVKNGDTNYGKTPETARLIEQEGTGEWTHVLLLKETNRPKVRHVFGDELVTDEQTRATIQSEEGPPVDVHHWQDISRTLRLMLTRGLEPDTHWQTSAYLFITLIEQRILKLHSVEFIDSGTADADAPAARDLHRLVALDPERQIEYLESVLAEDTTHE